MLLESLFSLRRGGVRRGLEGIEGLLEALGHPERRLCCVQVGGTNGKGSTAAWIASMLRACGVRVGLFTSPHLCRFEERFRIDGEEVVPERVERQLRRILEVAKAAGLEPLFFEVVTALGVCLFVESGVELAVMEVGLGGLLDPTSALPSVVSVLTSIGHDHERWLGKGLQAIAMKKAGMFRRGVPIVVGEVPGEILALWEEMAQEQGAGPLFSWGRDFVVKKGHLGDVFENVACCIDGFVLPLRGEHQRRNVGCALQVMHVLAQQREVLLGSERWIERLRLGVSQVRWEGRLQRLSWRGRELWLDGAHNAEAVAALARWVGNRRVHAVVGFAKDKSISSMVSSFSACNVRWYGCVFSHPRSCELETLRAALEGEKERLEDVFVGVEKTLERALVLAEPDALVLVFGSLFLVGEALSLCR